ncbi:hypothetical protein QFZ36_000393 [Pseudarthrobacter siccitolerans]|uniref:Uncharacterized protein n=1 Tax=Pseudarthrobacter siccitolerans TaxID=861266 RepID=A0ABU0PGM3_9MICC|nr:hypothetical protein [Pseudarthrobacter siccitolerans]MDQ0672832.1 hypothetical protein [Pseudarthrobacter siccitolerans]
MSDDLVHRQTAEKGKGSDGGRLTADRDRFLADRFNARNFQENAHWLAVPAGQQPGAR